MGKESTQSRRRSAYHGQVLKGLGVIDQRCGLWWVSLACQVLEGDSGQEKAGSSTRSPGEDRQGESRRRGWS